MTFYKFTLILIVLLAVSFRTAQAFERLTCKPAVTNGKMLTQACTQDDWSFTLNGQKTADAVRIETLDIVSPEGRAQSLATGASQYDTVYLDESGALSLPLELEDLNFDGYKDIRLRLANLTSHNDQYLHWLYNPAAKTFVAAPHLDTVLSGSDIGLDPASRTVTVTGLCCSGSSLDSYHWVKDRLVLQSQSLSGYLSVETVALSDLHPFIKADLICATDTVYFNDSGHKTKRVIETGGGPCPDTPSYREAPPVLSRQNGLVRHGATEDLYDHGILMQRTIFYGRTASKR